MILPTIHMNGTAACDLIEDLTRECEYGGWYGKNLATGREIRIRTAARLRSAITLVGATRIEQIRNLRADGMSYATASAIVNPTEF